MGQQQLLLLVLGAIIVGVAIVVGINMFSQNALTSNIDAVKQDCLTIISRAQQWYRTPTALGGPATHHTFTGLSFEKMGYGATLTTTFTNERGTFTLSAITATDFNLVGETIEQDGFNKTWTVTFTGVTSTTIPTAASAQKAG